MVLHTAALRKQLHPSRIGRLFNSRLHDERTAAWLGTWLGISFTVAFVTGLISHFMQHPASWMEWPSRPVNLYRLTQGVHVIGGIATIPLVFAKLWTVYPKLFQWPPFKSLMHAVERALVFLLIGGALFQLATGLMNIAYWYPFPFFFTAAHYWTAYIVFGALLIHGVNKWAKVRRNVLPRRVSVPSDPQRRAFFATVAAASGVVAFLTVGETFSPLARLALLAPRRPGVGPQHLPVNTTAAEAGVSVPGASWRLTVTGRVRRELSLSLADLAALPQHSVRLPISCVEGWSASASWQGVRMRDVLALAGVADDAHVRVESLEQGGRYRTSDVNPSHWQDPLTLLALGLNGSPLDADHGYPLRLIAPDRPGVLQTKWLDRMVVT